MSEVRIGVIGVGGMGSNHLTSISNCSRVKLTAVCDISQEQADKKATEYGVKAFYVGEELINSGEVDAILVATPHYDHPHLAIAGFAAGIHVLLEKPVAVHKADAEAMIKAHQQHPELKFAAMFQMRTNNIYQKIKQLIDKGELGEIKRVNWIATDWFRSQAYYDSGGWRATWQGEGGGVLLNQCPHNLDLFQWFFGMPTRIRAFCALGKYHDIEVEDDVTAYCEFRNGATGVFICSTGEAPGTNRLEISADRGLLVLENGQISFRRTEVPVDAYTRTTEERFRAPESWNIKVPTGNDHGSHQVIAQNFVDAILDDVEIIAPAAEGMNSVELANGMLLSSLKNEVVDIPMDATEFATTLQELIDNSSFSKGEVKKVEKDDLKESMKT